MSSLGLNDGVRERVIVYPLHRVDLLSDSELALAAACVCYQYEVDEYGYGPYGFDTEKSKKILSRTFTELFFLDVDKLSLVKVETINHRGLYFYVDDSHLESIRETLRAYRISVAKARLLKNKDVDRLLLDEPLILKIFTPEGIDPDCIQWLLSKSIRFFIRSFFMPVGNETLIFFERSFVEGIKLQAHLESVGFYEVDSVEKLPGW